jgi:hypothetical protein
VPLLVSTTQGPSVLMVVTGAWMGGPGTPRMAVHPTPPRAGDNLPSSGSPYRWGRVLEAVYFAYSSVGTPLCYGHLFPLEICPQAWTWFRRGYPECSDQSLQTLILFLLFLGSYHSIPIGLS